MTSRRASAEDDAVATELVRVSAQLRASRQELEAKDTRLGELTQQVAELRASLRRTAVVVHVAHRTVRRIAPSGSRQSRLAGAVLRSTQRTRPVPVGPTDRPPQTSEAGRFGADRPELAAEYRRWREQHEPGATDLDQLQRANGGWAWRPVVDIVLPLTGVGDIADVEARWLEETIDSVLAQVYDRWHLCIAPEDSTPVDAVQVAERHAAVDPRIRVVLPPATGGEGTTGATGSTGAPEGSVAAQRAAVASEGEWVVRLDSGDVLRPDALHRIVAHLTDHPVCDMVYADEDRIAPGGGLERPEVKPDWSPDYLLSRDYVGHPTAVRRALLESIGGWRASRGPAQEDHDLHLRASEQARQVGHVAAVLCSRRTAPHSQQPDTRASSDIGADNPVVAALQRRQLSGRAVVAEGAPDGEFWREPACYDVRYDIEGTPSVDIIIPTRDRVDLLRSCIDSITSLTTYPDYRITVVDNDSVDETTHRYLERTDLRVVPSPGAFNFSHLVNEGVRTSDADYVLLLNNDITVLTPDWIEALLELAQQDGVGAVGCRLLFPDGSVQHEGVALLPDYTAANISWPWQVIRDASAVTAACMLVRRDIYASIDGFDEDMGVVYNDVDFCLRMVRSGRRVVYTPHAELEHAESATRGRSNPQSDIDLFFARWGTPDRLRDPFVSPFVRWPHPQRLRVWN
jgi:GT2 family glycosyltransferase